MLYHIRVISYVLAFTSVTRSLSRRYSDVRNAPGQVGAPQFNQRVINTVRVPEIHSTPPFPHTTSTMGDIQLDDDIFNHEDDVTGPLFDTAERFEPENELTDLDSVSSLLITGDSYIQGDIVQGVLRPTVAVDPATAESRFINEVPRVLSLHQLKRDFERGTATAAMQHLGHRTAIGITEDDMYRSDSSELVWWKHEQRMDLLVVTPMLPGFTAILPNLGAHHNYSFHFTMAKPHVAWTAKYAKLGFDPARRMLFVGTVEGQQAWLAFAPKSIWHPELSLPKKYSEDHGAKSSLMPRGRYRRAVSMMASLCDSQQIQGIMNTSEYTEHIDEVETHAWSASINIK